MTWTGRYQQELTLSIRVWPVGDLAFRSSLAKAAWDVHGMTMNRNCHMAVVHKVATRNFMSWEMSDEDADRLASAGSAGAKFGKLVVRTPGVKVNTVRMECWLEVPLVLNPRAWKRTMKEVDPVMRGSDAEIAETVKGVWEQDLKRAGAWMHERYGYTEAQQRDYVENLPRREFAGLYYLIDPKRADLATLAAEVQKGKAVLVDSRLRGSFDIDAVDRALDCWRIPGAAPDEPGGEFNPLQLGRSVFWCEDASVPEWLRGDEAMVEKCRREAREEAMRARTQKHFIEQVTERIARRYGVSRERVTARFVEEGFFDWMVEESAKVRDDPARAKFPSVRARCRGPVDEAVKVLAFCIDATAIRPPDALEPLLAPKQREQRLEYRRKKLDALGRLPPEERERVLAEGVRRARNRPAQIVRRIVSAYAAEEGRTADEAMVELQRTGVFDLVVNGIRTRREAAGAARLADAQSKMYERIVPKAIRLLMRCRTGEAVEARDADKLIR